MLSKTLKSTMTGNTLPEKVAQIYYTYGLFCSSYPLVAITLALSIVMLCSYPLLNVPLPGNIPTVVNLPLDINNGQIFSEIDCSTTNCHKPESYVQEFLYNESHKLPYVWARDKPLLYIQQIIIKIGVSPWNSNLKVLDAFRAPLQEVFRILETIRNHEDPESKTTLLEHCYQIENIKLRESKETLEGVLPEYSCLLLSPANLWQQNIQSFSMDANIISTIYNYQNFQMGKVSTSEIAFGMKLRDTGIKRYPLRSRPRVLQYAITIFFSNADQRFITSLMKKLKEMYPLYQDHVDNVKIRDMSLIYYPGKFNYNELVPLMITFVGLFLYVYFSVRKIEFIKSKFGLAACAVATIAGSLLMSMGICFYFGFTLSLQGKEILPYLVIIVGLENILVLTKSVTSTDSRLDVKIRLAQGLSKEGWSITKNLLTEITIFTVSFFTFVPFIQEFSIFMIVSLLSDYFIQMVFFATVLGVDVRRMELFQERNSRLNLKVYFNSNNALNWRHNRTVDEDHILPQRLIKSKSHPRLNGLNQSSPTDVVAKRSNSATGHKQRVPKRIKLVNMWARTRFFQRAFMVWMLVWVSVIVYNLGIIDYFVTKGDAESKGDVSKKLNEKNGPKISNYGYSNDKNAIFTPLVQIMESDKTVLEANDSLPLKHSSQSRPWSRLSPYHWSSILSQYNESVCGRYVVSLPPVLLSHRVPAEAALRVRHPDEREPLLRWRALAAALDPVDSIPELESSEGVGGAQWGKAADLPMYPSTPMEMLLLAILCVISVAVIAYMMVVLYRCVCSRHYAEWRASWNDDEKYSKIIAKQPAIQLVTEAVPLVVSGHSQEVECIVTDGEKVVSTCLQGSVKVWDSHNGEIITDIDRIAYFKMQQELCAKLDATKSICNLEISPVVPSSRNQSNEGVYRLRKGLSNHISGLRFRCKAGDTSSQTSAAETTRYDFAKTYRDLYCCDQYSTDSEILESDMNDLKQTVNESGCKNNNVLDNDVFVFNSQCEYLVNTNDSELRVNNENLDSNSKSNINSVNGINSAISDSPVWCMDFSNDLIILGCADGRLEFWDASSGKLMCVWRRSGWRENEGVTHVVARAGARRVLAATLGGHLALFRLDAYNPTSGASVDWDFSTAHRRTHKRSGSAGSVRRVSDDTESLMNNHLSLLAQSHLDSEELVCTCIAQCRPHQQPITELQCEGGRVVTGGQDHVLKVFSSTELSPLFTLHGHCGPITSCFIDHVTPTIGGSGSQDGLLCVWDLHTGACLYSMQAHDGAVTSLAYTASYVVSAGADERLCIWDRFQGHMLNSIQIGLNYMSRMLPLTHSLLVMGDRGGLTVYDLSSGDIIRRVLLGDNDGCVFVRQILPLDDAIVCDYATQLRIVRFPLVSKLCDMKNE